MSKDDKGRIKMTVVHFETESDNETLKENIRSISITLAKALASNNQRIIQQNPQHLANGEKLIEEGSIVEESDSDFEMEEIPQKQKSKKSTVRNLRTPKVLEIDLKKGEVTLEKFVEGKKLDTDQKKYLAIAYWLKKYGKIDDIHGDHAYTCFKHLEWTVPPDPWKPFSNMKGKQYGWFVFGKTPGTFTLSHIGENKIEKILKE